MLLAQEGGMRHPGTYTDAGFLPTSSVETCCGRRGAVRLRRVVNGRVRADSCLLTVAAGSSAASLKGAYLKRHGYRARMFITRFGCPWKSKSCVMSGSSQKLRLDWTCNGGLARILS